MTIREDIAKLTYEQHWTGKWEDEKAHAIREGWLNRADAILAKVREALPEDNPYVDEPYNRGWNAYGAEMRRRLGGDA